jgi:formate--tetrahydrofolate ligase
MNDRALRDMVIGLGGVANGIVREDRFVIIPASEVMAIVALATSPADLEQRLGRIIVGSTAGADRKPVRASDLKAHGAMAMLLKDAIPRRSGANLSRCLKSILFTAISMSTNLR